MVSDSQENKKTDPGMTLEAARDGKTIHEAMHRQRHDHGARNGLEIDFGVRSGASRTDMGDKARNKKKKEIPGSDADERLSPSDGMHDFGNDLDSADRQKRSGRKRDEDTQNKMADAFETDRGPRA